VRVSRIQLINWRNFQHVDVDLSNRMFIVGPNASGKSNLLDVFRFLRDIVVAGGGIQRAVEDRGGLSKIRCLAARSEPTVQVKVALSENGADAPEWQYNLSLRVESRGHRRVLVDKEQVWQRHELILSRPDENDDKDEERLTQSHLEQIGSNQEFRPISKFFGGVSYLHLIPQVVRNPEAFSGPGMPVEDPFGRGFLDRVIRTPKTIRRSRLRRIEQALRVAVPQLRDLSDVQDQTGTPHLEAVYEHWRPNAGKQREDQFSDGTLRLIGLFWAMLESDPLLLLEEPELSLNAAIVSHLPSLLYRLQRQSQKQLIVSTHSFDLLTDRGIGAEEVLVLSPGEQGTDVRLASSLGEIHGLLHGGMTLGDALQPYMAPKDIGQIELAL